MKNNRKGSIAKFNVNGTSNQKRLLEKKMENLEKEDEDLDFNREITISVHADV